MCATARPWGANTGGTEGQTVGAFKASMRRQCVTVRNVFAAIVNLYDTSALTLACGGCLSRGQGSRHNRGLLEQEGIPLIIRRAL